MFVALLFSGCGGNVSPDGFFDAEGSVQWNGEPLQTGWIVFRAADSSSKNVAAQISDGSFTVNIQPGEKIVEITAERDVPGKFGIGPSGEKVPAKEAFIPPKYNTESELKSTVTFPLAEPLTYQLTDA
ncbi:hypothetical protein [Rosistilla ulvae]|nr:hypothetical protein [Rosistilla ulvae]